MQISAVQVNLALRSVKETKAGVEQVAPKAAGSTSSAPLSRADTFERGEPIAAAAIGPITTLAAAVESVEDLAKPAQGSPTPAQNSTRESATTPTQDPVGESTQPVQPRTYSAADRDALLASWGARTGEQRYIGEYDLDADGVIGSSDLAQLLGAFKADPAAPSSPTQNSVPPATDSSQPPVSPELKAIKAAWNKQVGDEGYDTTYDLNGDGTVNSSDLALFLGGQNNPATKPLATPAPALTPAPEVKTPADAHPPLADQIKDLNAAWGARNGEQAFNAAFDFDGDGVITSADLAHLLGQANQQG